MIHISSKYNSYLTQEEKETILIMHNEGYNTVEIAKELNRSDSSIGRFQKKNDLLNFYNLIYQDSNFYLQRKKEKFENYFTEHRVNTEVTNQISKG